MRIVDDPAVTCPRRVSEGKGPGVDVAAAAWAVPAEAVVDSRAVEAEVAAVEEAVAVEEAEVAAEVADS
jgi:hypothetical protein